MHEIAPHGYAPFLEAIGAVAEAYHAPRSSEANDPKAIGAAVFAIKYSKEFSSEDLVDPAHGEIELFFRIYKTLYVNAQQILVSDCMF